MKIDMQSQLPVYRKQSGAESTPASVPTPVEIRRDVVDIAHGNTGTDKTMVGLKASVHNHVNTATDPARISELREKVRSGEYNVETEDIVNAMLGLR